MRGLARFLHIYDAFSQVFLLAIASNTREQTMVLTLVHCKLVSFMYLFNLIQVYSKIINELQ